MERDRPDTGMGRATTCLSSSLRCCLFKGGKETWKHIICYYSSLRMQRTKGTFRFKKSLPLSLLINCYFGPRRVKEEASKGGALGFMIRVNCKPRTRPQTKGSGAAPPTVGRAGCLHQTRARWTPALLPPDFRNLFLHRELCRRSATRTPGPTNHLLPKRPPGGPRTAAEKRVAFLSLRGLLAEGLQLSPPN